MARRFVVPGHEYFEYLARCYMGEEMSSTRQAGTGEGEFTLPWIF
jgi:hypothetical protein